MTMLTAPVPLVRVARPRLPDDQKVVLHPLSVLLRALEDKLTYDQRGQIEQEFSEHLANSTYPVLVGNRLMDRVCELGLADRPIGEARQLLATAYMSRYKETILGRILGATMPLMKPEWILRGCPRNYASATNFGTYWVAELEPRHWRFDFEDDPGYPDWILGTLISSCEVLRIPGVRISYQVLEPQHTSFDIHWEGVK